MLNVIEPGVNVSVIADTDVMTAEFTECERVGRELETARRAYEELFPSRLQPIAGLDYFGANHPARDLGGDYFDFLHFLSSPNPKLGVAIGDVSGKGIAAAL